MHIRNHTVSKYAQHFLSHKHKVKLHVTNKWKVNKLSAKCFGQQACYLHIKANKKCVEPFLKFRLNVCTKMKIKVL